jgi:hypothetical protein
LREELETRSRDVQAYSITAKESTDFKIATENAVFIRGCIENVVWYLNIHNYYW